MVELQASATSERSLLGVDWQTAQGKLTHGQMIPNPGTFYRAGFFAKHGSFDETFRIAGDYEMLLRELPENEAHFLANTVITGMHPGGISSSPGLTILQWKEVRRAQVMHGQKIPSCFWIRSIGRARSRDWMRRVWGDEKSAQLVGAVRALFGTSRS